MAQILTRLLLVDFAQTWNESAPWLLVLQRFVLVGHEPVSVPGTFSSPSKSELASAAIIQITLIIGLS